MQTRGKVRADKTSTPCDQHMFHLDTLTSSNDWIVQETKAFDFQAHIIAG